MMRDEVWWYTVCALQLCLTCSTVAAATGGENG